MTSELTAVKAIQLSEQITIYALFQKCMDTWNWGIIGFFVSALYCLFILFWYFPYRFL